MQQCTFHPQINDKSARLFQATHYSQPTYETNDKTPYSQGMSVAERLYRKKMESDMKIKMQQEQREKSQLVGCTFHPNIQTNIPETNKFYSNYFK
mmetsp:Transcript_34057/g.33250  ORF Transcript_34057/g.33250 Transcript_34057/m.33250 type:complete len:95 (+) Transcript_34057:658-942(+)